MLDCFLFHSKNREKSIYLWNMCSSMLNAFQTVFVLMIISRIDPVMDAGIFTIAFAIGNLMLTIGNYGIRQFQVSDVQEKYRFRDYLVARGFTCGVMILASVVYVGYYKFIGLYSLEKSIVILLVCLAKGIDAFEDVFLGVFQQRERLDISGKILSVRLTGYIGIYLITYIITHNLILASLLSLAVSFFLFLFLNLYAYKYFPARKDAAMLNQRDRKRSIALLWECLPLFISSYLVMYVSNAPKYAIDKVLSSEDQACFTYVFMPVFVIGLLSQFVYQPIIGKLSMMWHKQKMREFKALIIKQILIILALAMSVIIGGYLLGIPLLSILYGVNLSGYHYELVILLIGGMFLAYTYFFQMILTVTRSQKLLVWGYVIAYILCILLGKTIVEMHGLLGISVFYTIIMLMIAAIFGGIAIIIIRKNQTDTERMERCIN